MVLVIDMHPSVLHLLHHTHKAVYLMNLLDACLVIILYCKFDNASVVSVDVFVIISACCSCMDWL